MDSSTLGLSAASYLQLGKLLLEFLAAYLAGRGRSFGRLVLFLAPTFSYVHQLHFSVMPISPGIPPL